MKMAIVRAYTEHFGLKDFGIASEIIMSEIINEETIRSGMGAIRKLVFWFSLSLCQRPSMNCDATIRCEPT